MGMTGTQAIPKGAELLKGVNWVLSIGKDVPLGTVYISHSSFLEGILLKYLERINHQTTMVPEFWGVTDKKWIFDLVEWDNHKAKKGKRCVWRDVTMQDSSMDHLQFAWRNKDMWNYKNDFDEEILYSMRCITRNTLVIPTKHMGDCDIQLHGTVEIELEYSCGDPGKDWRYKNSTYALFP
ncbi:uncharacterized protein FOMMEDRAFT_31083 [Fomitiporia mediterranea MF3/22]|uniref:uncharacterized protein n=1 Tax=Fomitiporia mediterranea (strain MF3/22) TaxID=694068 RepID=UPI00044082A7|nr:uncharacterized protein FOMMEDRAFT_31083 [Fomitiporia mediterranea MF3/22]EJC99828.1 hypothetical protein FOMMEDRAFT_31083 [Fomitiporia mediterranea MF3/22]